MSVSFMFSFYINYEKFFFLLSFLSCLYAIIIIMRLSKYYRDSIHTVFDSVFKEGEDIDLYIELKNKKLDFK